MGTTPTVYFLREGDDGPIKIGFTTRKSKYRIREGQTFHSKELRLLAEAMGTKDMESALHVYFGPYKIRGELFEPNPELMDLILYLQDGGTLQSWLDAVDVDASIRP